MSVMASTEGLSGLPQMSPRTTRMVAVTCPKGFLATTLYKPASDGAAGFKVKIEWPSSVLTMLNLEKKRKKVNSKCQEIVKWLGPKICIRYRYTIDSGFYFDSKKNVNKPKLTYFFLLW